MDILDEEQEMTTGSIHASATPLGTTSRDLTAPTILNMESVGVVPTRTESLNVLVSKVKHNVVENMGQHFNKINSYVVYENKTATRNF